MMLFGIPLLASFLNVRVNALLANKIDDMESIIYVACIRCIYDYIVSVVQSEYLFRQSHIMWYQMKLRLELAKVRCGVYIPGCNQAQFKELIDDDYKLREFLFVAPFLWCSIINVSISIYNLEPINGYSVRVLFAIFCIFIFCLLTYLTDASLYDTTKPNDKVITDFSDSNMVRTKLAMKCNIDELHGITKMNKQNRQQRIQRHIIWILNLIITFISLLSGKNHQIYSFGNITWMISCLSDNIKSLQYKNYVKDFIELCEVLEKYEYHHKQIVPIEKINYVRFESASFGYYDDDITKSVSYTSKINNLTYQFNSGKLYYFEDSNGIGKSTLLRMFSHNLHRGQVYFNNINRTNISFEDVHKNIFHVHQASEYTPILSKNELTSYKNRDLWLEQQLGITTFFDKSMIELSGGQKKRMIIYIALTSGSPVILFDETLSELSSEETPEVKEGGGWLGRVINTIAKWNGRSGTIILMVGHGLVNLIPNQKHIIKLRINNTNNQTSISYRH